jgi:predicted nucleic acid-binding Zn ribbon protein
MLALLLLAPPLALLAYHAWRFVEIFRAGEATGLGPSPVPAGPAPPDPARPPVRGSSGSAPGGQAVPVCPSCARAFRPGERFCQGCGASLASRDCGACGAALPPAARFCKRCGHRAG